MTAKIHDVMLYKYIANKPIKYMFHSLETASPPCFVASLPPPKLNVLAMNIKVFAKWYWSFLVIVVMTTTMVIMFTSYPMGVTAIAKAQCPAAAPPPSSHIRFVEYVLNGRRNVFVVCVAWVSGGRHIQAKLPWEMFSAREPTNTTTQSLLGETSMRKANNHYQCKTCWEICC